MYQILSESPTFYRRYYEKHIGLIFHIMYHISYYHILSYRTYFGSSVLTTSHRAKSFLSGCVPETTHSRHIHFILIAADPV